MRQEILTYNRSVILRSNQTPRAFPDIKVNITREFVHPHPLVLDIEYLAPSPNGSSGDTHDFSRVPEEFDYPFGDCPCLFKVVRKDAEARTISIELGDKVELVRA